MPNFVIKNTFSLIPKYHYSLRRSTTLFYCSLENYRSNRCLMKNSNNNIAKMFKIKHGSLSLTLHSPATQLIRVNYCALLCNFQIFSQKTHEYFYKKCNHFLSCNLSHCFLKSEHFKMGPSPNTDVHI